MALEDLTGTGKFLSALNPAWPVDDDWVDEGDNHIRGIKNVLKNTFPVTDAAVSWSSTQARFPDGSLSAPGISWVSDPDSGWVRGAADVYYSMNAVPRFTMAVSGATTINSQVVVTSGLWDGVVGSFGTTNVRIDAPAGKFPAIGLQDPSVSRVWIVGSVNGYLKVGRNDNQGPASQGGYALTVGADGQCWARNFWQVSSFAARSAGPIVGALDAVLKLRGVRGVDAESGAGRVGLEVESVAGAFPELVSAGDARGLDHAGVVAVLVEAVRELSARVKVLEAALESRVAGR